MPLSEGHEDPHLLLQLVLSTRRLCISMLHLHRKQRPKKTSIRPKDSKQVQVDHGQELHTSLCKTQQHYKLGPSQKAE